MRQADSILTEHGGRLDEAMRLYPTAPTPWLDLSTGINPVGWAPHAPIPVDSGPLPSRGAVAKLEAVAACYFGVDRWSIAAVPGTEIALRLLPTLGVPRPIRHVPPTYATHVIVSDGEDGPDEDAGTQLLANPNNPDGRIASPDQLHYQVTRSAGWMVVDEAFADPTPANSVIAGLDGHERVVVLRSFGKFFGLAGLRLGFVIGPAAMIARLRALLGDWPVSAHAIAWGTAAYADAEWVAATRRSLHAQAARLDAMLARRGLAATGACPLFRLVQHPEAIELFQRLARAGILSRPFDYRDDWLRLGLPGSEAALERLDRALGRG